MEERLMNTENERALLRAAAEAELEAIRVIVGGPLTAWQEEALRTAFKAGAAFGVKRGREQSARGDVLGVDLAGPGGDRSVEVIGTVREGVVTVTEVRESNHPPRCEPTPEGTLCRHCGGDIEPRSGGTP
jgi:hypothetical protein